MRTFSEVVGLSQVDGGYIPDCVQEVLLATFGAQIVQALLAHGAEANAQVLDGAAKGARAIHVAGAAGHVAATALWSPTESAAQVPSCATFAKKKRASSSLPNGCSRIQLLRASLILR